MANNYCISCGTRLPANAKFCPECGTKVEFIISPEQTSQLQPVQPSLNPATETSSGNHLPVEIIDGSYWICPYCRFRNPSTTNICDNCKSQVNLSIPKTSPQINNVSSYTCSFCGQENDSSNNRCISCGTSISSKNWRCPSCGTFNGLSYSVCYVCGFNHNKLKKANVKPAANAPLSDKGKKLLTVYAVGDVFPYWTCPECGSKNRQLLSRCQNCNTEVNVVRKEISKPKETKDPIQQEHKKPSYWFIICLHVLWNLSLIRAKSSADFGWRLIDHTLSFIFAMIIFSIMRKKHGAVASNFVAIISAFVFTIIADTILIILMQIPTP